MVFSGCVQGRCQHSHTAERLFRTQTVPKPEMSADTRESVFGDRTNLLRGLLYASLVLGTFGVGVVDGGSHWFFAAVVMTVVGIADLYSASERRRQLLSLVGIAAVLATALVIDFGLLP